MVPCDPRRAGRLACAPGQRLVAWPDGREHLPAARRPASLAPGRGAGWRAPGDGLHRHRRARHGVVPRRPGGADRHPLERARRRSHGERAGRLAVGTRTHGRTHDVRTDHADGAPLARGRDRGPRAPPRKPARSRHTAWNSTTPNPRGRPGSTGSRAPRRTTRCRAGRRCPTRSVAARSTSCWTGSKRRRPKHALAFSWRWRTACRRHRG